MSGPYTAAWKEYKRRRNTVIAAFVIGGPAVFVIGATTYYALHSPIVFYALAISLCAFVWISGLRFAFWRCPRCHNWFAMYGPFISLIGVSKCVHCNLPKFDDGVRG